MTFTHELQQGLSPYRDKFNEVVRFLLAFLKNPIQGMRTPPDWEWPVLLISHAAISAVCGALGGLVEHKITRFFGGLLIYPISSTLIIFVVAGFFYYTFMFILHREVQLKKLVTIIILATLPTSVLLIVSYYLPPITLFGLLVTSLLLIVGLSENTGVDRKKITKLVGAIYAVYLIFWIFNSISLSQDKRSIKDMATPESLDILEKELKEGN